MNNAVPGMTGTCSSNVSARGRARTLGAIVLSTCAIASGCSPAAVEHQLARSGRHAGDQALSTMLRVLTPGLGIPCAGRQGERRFTEANAIACVRRVATNYVHGVRRSFSQR